MSEKVHLANREPIEIFESGREGKASDIGKI